ncbi:hypothetical protein [Fontivita pretiosa]|uniref:hypothetical protein n=1 Tax=Fontivita pretiosa TaxID=2989684 RepID=UPI003D17AE24
MSRRRRARAAARIRQSVIEALESRTLLAGGQWFKINGISSYVRGSTVYTYYDGSLTLNNVPTGGWVQATSLQAAIEQYVTGTFRVDRSADGAGIGSFSFPGSAYKVSGSSITLEDMTGMTSPTPDDDFDDWAWTVDIQKFVDPGCGCDDKPLGEVHPGYKCPESPSSEGPVNYLDGSLTHVSTDLSTEAFGWGFGHTRRWTNRGSVGYQNVNGAGFVVTEQPRLVAHGYENDYWTGLVPEVVQVVLSASTSAWFDRALFGGSYVPRFSRGDALVQTTVTDDNQQNRWGGSTPMQRVASRTFTTLSARPPHYQTPNAVHCTAWSMSTGMLSTPRTTAADN